VAAPPLLLLAGRKYNSYFPESNYSAGLNYFDLDRRLNQPITGNPSHSGYDFRITRQHITFFYQAWIYPTQKN